MDSLLERLCEILDDELERQENVLAICVSQGYAARAHDLEHVEAKNEALGILIRDAVAAEEERLVVVGRVVEAYQLPLAKQTLSGLIDAAPEPWRNRLREIQVRMRAIVEETRRVVRDNNIVMRRSLKVVNNALGMLCQCVPSENGAYNARGEEHSRVHGTTNVIDQRG